MICEVCGREAAADRETGYDADRICPDCTRQGWTEEGGEIVKVELAKPEPMTGVGESASHVIDILTDDDIPF